MPLLRALFPRPAGLILLLFLSTTAGTVAPAAAQDVRRITLEEAVRIALRQNVDLRQATNAVEEQRTVVSDRRMAFAPDLTLSTSAGQQYGRQFSAVESGIVDQTNEIFSAEASSSLTLFDGFGNVAALRQARSTLEADGLVLDRQRQTVVFDVLTEYLDLVERGERVRILEENLEAQRQLLAQIQAFVDVGSRPISDLYQQQAAVAAAELDVLDAERAFQLAEAAVIQTLQLDPLDTYAFAAPALQNEALEPEAYDPADLLRRAFAQRPDLQALAPRVEAAREGIRAARATRYPRLDLRAGYGSEWTSAADFFAGGQELGFFDQLDRNRSGGVQLSLSVPLFDRFTARNGAARARVQFENTQFEQERLRQEVALQVRQAYLDYRTAEKRLDVTAKQLRAAEQALEATRERYNLGATTLVELSQAQAESVQAARERVQARYDFLFQEKRIDYFVGVLDPSGTLFE